MTFSITVKSTIAILLLLAINTPHLAMSLEQTKEHECATRMQPYALLPPDEPCLTKTQEDALSYGQAVRVYWPRYNRELIIQDVDAPPQVVMETILDYDNYKDMVPKALGSTVYRREEGRLWVHLQSGVPGFKLNLYSAVVYDLASRTIAWTLDQSQKSDMDDVVGCKSFRVRSLERLLYCLLCSSVDPTT
jgi:Polyketide cyclase / dehydrase and lipid transport